MPINKSLGREMDKRTRELEKRETGSGSQALQEQQLAQNQLQAIQNEQRSNLMSQRTEAAAMDQQNQLLSQAAELGVSSSTAATLGKYGMKSPPRVQRQQGRQVSVTPNKITIINNTTTTTTNQVNGGGGGGDDGSASKFKTWLSKVNTQQAEQASKRERDYARRESSLTRSANKMLRRIEKVGGSVAEAFSPQTFGQTLGSQLKMYLLIFGMKFLTKYWDKVLGIINWVGETFETVTGWLGIGTKGEAYAKQGKGLIPTFIKLLGGDPQKESVKDAFKKSMISVFDYFSMKLNHMMEERSIAMQKVKLDIKSDGLGGVLKDTGLGDLFRGVTTYLGDILTVLINPKAGTRKQVARDVQKIGMKGSEKHMNKGQHESAAFGVDKGDLSVLDKGNKYRYGLVEGAVGPGNILTSKAGGQISQSLDVVGALRDAKETGYVDPARFLAGLERMQDRAKSSGFVSVDPEFLTTFLSAQTIRSLTAAKHIRYRKYKVIKVKKASAESLGDYLKDAGTGTAIGAVVGSVVPGVGTSTVALVGGAVGTVNAFINDMANNDHTLEFVPLDDQRESFDGKVYTLCEIDEYVLKRIAQSFGTDYFDTANEKLMEQVRRFMYQRAGGFAATKQRYKGRGGNESMSVSSVYKPIHEMEATQKAHKEEEKNSDWNIRKERSKEAVGEVIDNTLGFFEDAYQDTKDFFTKPTGETSGVGYNPADYTAKAGMGPRTANSVVRVSVPSPSGYNDISTYSEGPLRSPMKTDYTFSTQLAIQEAEKLSKLIITGKPRKDWKSKSSTDKGKSTYLATYLRLAVAKGLGKTDLEDRPKRSCEFAGILYKYGFVPVEWSIFSPKRGDICIFGPTTNKYPDGYACIYSGSKWISDYVQNSIWPDDEFKSERTATIFRHLHPVSDNSSAVSELNSYGATEGSGFIDVNGDGKWDFLKTDDGSYYRLTESGAIEKVSADEVQSQITGDSAFSSLSNFGDSDSATPTAFVSTDVGSSSYAAWSTSREGFGSNKWANAVVLMGKWYKSHFRQYSNTCSFGCQLLPGRGKVRPDCSGFVSACLVLYGIPVYNPNSDRSEGNGGPMAKVYAQQGKVSENQLLASKLIEGGFTPIPRSELGKYGGLKPWDIIANFKHVEVTADGQGQSYNAGSTDAITKGMPRGDKPFLNQFTFVWRCTSTPSNVGTNNMLDSKGDDIKVGAWDSSNYSDISTTSSVEGGNAYSWNLSGYSSSSSSGGGGASVGSPITNAQTKQNAVSLINYFKKNLGLTTEQAAGIVGSLLGESPLNSASYVQNDNGGPSGGIGGWHDNPKKGYHRFTDLKKFAAARGKSWTDFEVQAEFIANDLLNGGYKDLYKKIKNATSAEQVAELWGQKYEVFSGYNDLQGKEHMKRKGFARNLVNSYSKEGSDNINFTNGAVEDGGAGKVFDVVEKGVSKASEAVQSVYNNVKTAINGELLGKTQIVTLEKDANSRISKMSDDQLAAQIWLNNSSIRNQYDAYGFEGWKKYVFDKLPSRKTKERYLVEEEGKSMLASVSTLSDGTGLHWTGLRNVLGFDIKPEYFDERTGNLTPEGLSLFGPVYASMSPKERNIFLQRVKLESNWHDALNDIKQKKELGDYTEDEKKNFMNLLGISDKRDTAFGYLLSGDLSSKGIMDDDLGRKISEIYNDSIVTTKDKTVKARLAEIREGHKTLSDLYKYLQLGDIDRAKSAINTLYTGTFGDKLGLVDNVNKIYGSKVIDQLIGPNKDLDLSLYTASEHYTRDLLSRAFAKKQYDEVQEGINKFLQSNTYKEYAGVENLSKKGDLDSALSFVNGMYKLFKGKYVQEHLTEGFESITENDTAEEAYEKNQRNQKRAEVNKEKYDLEYQQQHWNEDYYDRMEKDQNFRNDMYWKYGFGDEANAAMHNSQWAKDQEQLTNKRLEELNERLAKINEEHELVDIEGIRKKFDHIIDGTTVVSAEELNKITNYSTTGDQVYNQKLLELTNQRDQARLGVHWDPVKRKMVDADGNDIMTDYDIYQEAQKAMQTHMKQDVWQSLMDDMIKGNRTVQEARYILDNQGLGKQITNDQLLEIKKSGKYNKDFLSTRSELDENGNIVTKWYDASGKVIQKDDYERDKEGNIIYDKKGNRKKIKRDVTIDDAAEMQKLIDQAHETESLGLVGGASLNINGKNLPMMNIMGKQVYWDKDSGNYYNLQGKLAGNFTEENLSLYPSFMQSMMAPTETSQATAIQQMNFEKRLKEGMHFAGEEFSTKKGATVSTRQLDMSQYGSEDEMVKGLKNLLGEALTEKMENEMRDQYNQDKNAKVEISTFKQGDLTMSGAFINGEFVQFPDATLAAKQLNAVEAHAKRLGYSSEEAKVYADNQFRQQSEWAEIQKRMDAEGLTFDAVTAEYMTNIHGQLTTIQTKLEQKKSEEEENS